MTTTVRAREVALEALLNRRGGRVPAGALEAELDASARNQVTDLVLGVQRNIFLLDAVLRRLLRRPLKELPPRIREILRLGVYEMMFRDRGPRSVVVDASVMLAGGKKALRGLVNAVLRKVADGLTLEESDVIPVARDAVFAGPGRIARFNFAVLPPPEGDPLKFRSLHFTQTPWFTDRITSLAGKDTDRLLAALNTPLPLTLRPVRVSMEELTEELVAAGVEVLREIENVVEVRLPCAVPDLVALREGRCVVQDVVPASVAPMIAPIPGERILDLCAAPGGKTLHLAELMRDQGEIIAADVDPDRLARIQEGAQRLGFSCVQTHDLGKDGKNLPEGPFDRVLVDAPCSNSGVLMKRVEARFRLLPEAMGSLERLQDALLHRAAPLVRPGGRLVYSTCSILPEENERRVAALIARHPEFVLSAHSLKLPTETGRDGGFWAVLVRGTA